MYQYVSTIFDFFHSSDIGGLVFLILIIIVLAIIMFTKNDEENDVLELENADNKMEK